jgi:hypothetical protein
VKKRSETEKKQVDDYFMIFKKVIKFNKRKKYKQPCVIFAEGFLCDGHYFLIQLIKLHGG